MSFDPINDKSAAIGAGKADKVNELQEIDFSNLDFGEIEKRASIFVDKTKFVPVDEQVKLVSVEKNGKIIYEDEGKMQLANSQAELAEMKNEDDNAIKGFLGGFFGKSKSMFNKKDDNFI